jgi:hypothetical protein
MNWSLSFRYKSDRKKLRMLKLQKAKPHNIVQETAGKDQISYKEQYFSFR